MSLKRNLPAGLSIWLYIASIIAIVNTLQCYISGPQHAKSFYPLQPEEVTWLTARMFGCWTLLSAVIRAMTGYQLSRLRNSRMRMFEAAQDSRPSYTFNSYTCAFWYYMTMFSFLLTSLHFLSEILFYGTSDLSSLTVIATLVFSSLSFLWMAFGRSFYLFDRLKTHPT